MSAAMWPPILTYGALDSVAADDIPLVADPVLMVWKSSMAPNSGLRVIVFADGGSIHGKDMSVRYVLRGTVDKLLGVRALEQKRAKLERDGNPNAAEEAKEFVRGDIIRVLQYARGSLSTGERYAKVKDMEYLHTHLPALTLPDQCGLKHPKIVEQMKSMPLQQGTQQPSGSTAPTLGTNPSATPAGNGYGPTRKVDTQTNSSLDTLNGGSRASPYGRDTSEGSKNGVGDGRRSVGSTKPVGSVFGRSSGPIVKIQDLTSFMGRWTIKGRVVIKSDMRHFSNNRGEGCLFSIDIRDKDGGEIRGTFFNGAAEKFYNIIQPNGVYTFGRGQIRVANKKFNNLKHMYELQFGEDAEVNACEDGSDIPRTAYEFKSIASLDASKKGDMVDIMAVPLKFGPVTTLAMKDSGKTRQKKDVIMLDTSGVTISLTLWGTKMNELPETILEGDSKSGEIDMKAVAIKNARVDEFNGKKLTTLSMTAFEVNPPIRETKELLDWAIRERVSADAGARFPSLTVDTAGGFGVQGGALNRMMKRKDIETMKQEVKSAMDGSMDDKGLWFSVCGTLLDISVNNRKWYWVACPDCGRKIQQDTADQPEMGGFNQQTEAAAVLTEKDSGFCGHCNKDVSKAVRKYNLFVEIADQTGTVKCSCLADHAIGLMGGISADDVVATQREELTRKARASALDPTRAEFYPETLGYEGDVDEQTELNDMEGKGIKGDSVTSNVVKGLNFSDLFDRRMFREYIFRIQARAEYYMDERRIKYRLFAVEPLNAIVESKIVSSSGSGLAVCVTNMTKECHGMIQMIKARLQAAAAA